MENTPEYNSRSGRVLTGAVILVWGVLLLLQRTGFPIPEWLFTLPMLLIVIGLVIGIRRGFRGAAPFVLIGIGGFLLARHQGWIHFSIGHYFWPVLFIIAGLAIILRPRRNLFSGGYMANDADGNNVFDSVAVFWGAKRTILSKAFSKGEIVNVFGGTEINFTQADISGTAVVDVVCIFGGVKLIVPKDWDVRVNVVHIFAGTDDKRNLHIPSESKKVLLVNGVAIFGGIDIISY
jgi:predicted membrane protein